MVYKLYSKLMCIMSELCFIENEKNSVILILFNRNIFIKIKSMSILFDHHQKPKIHHELLCIYNILQYIVQFLLSYHNGGFLFNFKLIPKK